MKPISLPSNSMKKLSLFSLSLFISIGSFAQAFLQTPIEGKQGKDWIIVNYVDWELTGFKDHNCGTKSYDGHQGTDFTLRSFRQMDSGVNVLAAAAGRVTFIRDGEYDRETDGDVTKLLGNYIAIKHDNLYYTYYGHLKNNSITVSEGDSVNIGDVIGQVGSSGNSTDAHLHFELWYDSTTVVDPFMGTCGNATNLWLTPESYDTSVGVFESGILSQNDLNINDLRERNTTLSRPFTLRPSSDSSLNFWSHLYGLKAGKELSLTWYTPENTTWFNYTFTLDQDYWYYYYWSFINHQDLTEGTWNVKLAYDGSEVSQETFEISKTASISSQKASPKCSAYKSMSLDQLTRSPNLEISLSDIQGRQINPCTTVLDGLHLISIRENGHTCILKRMGNK